MSSEPNVSFDRRGSVGGIAAGMGWLAANKFVTMVMSFGSMMILARLLSPADFGIMAAAMLVVALASAIFEGAFGINLVRRSDLDDHSVATTFWLSAAIGLLTFLAIAIVSPGVEAFFDFENLAWVLFVASSSILFKAIGSVSQSLLQRRGQFQLLATTGVTSYFIGNCVCSVVLAWQGFGVWSLVIGSTATAVIESLTNLSFARIPWRVPPSRAAAGEVFRLSGWFAVSQVLNWGATAGANAVIGRTLGAGPLGIYSRGWKLLDIIVSATAQPMQRVLLPAFAEKHGDWNDVNRAFIKALTIAAFIFTAFSALAVIHARAAVLVALGAQWTATIPIVQLLFAALLPRCCYKISEALAYACGSSFSATVRQAIYAAMVVGGAIIGSHWGPTAVAAAVSLALWCFYLISLAYVVAITGIQTSALVAAHTRAVLLVAPGAIVDVGLLTVAPLPFWSAQVVAGCSGVAVILMTFFVAPKFLLGDNLIQFRWALAGRIKQAAWTKLLRLR